MIRTLKLVAFLLPVSVLGIFGQTEYLPKKVYKAYRIEAAPLINGVFDDEDIIMDLLKSIKTRTKIPFVLHGGSGVDEKKIKESIKEGVNIINIGTDIKVAFTDAIKKSCKAIFFIFSSYFISC